MITGFLGQFRTYAGKPAEKEEPEQTQKPPESEKSSDTELFIKNAKTQSFIKKWSGKKASDGKPIYTKRGIVGLLKAIHRDPDLEKDEDVLLSGDEILSMLGGMDGLSSFLMGWKAKSEGIMKGLKSVLGGGD
jgi:hypothetical protein